MLYARMPAAKEELPAYPWLGQQWLRDWVEGPLSNIMPMMDHINGWQHPLLQAHFAPEELAQFVGATLLLNHLPVIEGRPLAEILLHRAQLVRFLLSRVPVIDFAPVPRRG